MFFFGSEWQEIKAKIKVEVRIERGKSCYKLFECKMTQQKEDLQDTWCDTLKLARQFPSK